MRARRPWTSKAGHEQVQSRDRAEVVQVIREQTQNKREPAWLRGAVTVERLTEKNGGRPLTHHVRLM